MYTQSSHINNTTVTNGQRSNFIDNCAEHRRGAITSLGSTILVIETNMYNDSAHIGTDISACGGNVTIDSIVVGRDSEFSSYMAYKFNDDVSSRTKPTEC